MLAPRRKGWTRFWVDQRGVRASAFQGSLAKALHGIHHDDLRHLHVVAGGWAEAAGLPAQLLDAGVSVGFVPHAGFVLRPRRGRGSGAVFADPNLDLPAARAEGRAVARGLQASPRLGPEATRQAFFAALREVDVLHFAGHGVLRLSDPWESHLRLAGGERVGLADLLVADSRANLVVLSGCRTGAPTVLAREDVLGLPEALLVAGVRSVLGAGRLVPDEETRVFMARFYAEGGARQPGLALQRTARALRAEGLSVWDAFRLVGLP